MNNRLSVKQVFSEHTRRRSYSDMTTSGGTIQDIVLHTCALGFTYAHKIIIESTGSDTSHIHAYIQSHTSTGAMTASIDSNRVPSHADHFQCAEEAVHCFRTRLTDTSTNLPYTIRCASPTHTIIAYATILCKWHRLLSTASTDSSQISPFS